MGCAAPVGPHRRYDQTNYDITCEQPGNGQASRPLGQYLRFRASIQIAILLTARFWGRQLATASALFAVDRYPLSEGAEEESQGRCNLVLPDVLTRARRRRVPCWLIGVSRTLRIARARISFKQRRTGGPDDSPSSGRGVA